MRNWLREYREKRGLTQEETAQLSEISRSYYTNIEQGKRNPTVDIAKKIAKTLKFDWVIFFENKCSLKEHKRVV